MPPPKKIYSFILLVAFLFSITPDEFIHALTGHSDTVDHYSGQVSVSTRHIHCSALQLTLPPFHSSSNSPILCKKTISHTPVVYFYSLPLAEFSFRLPSLRAPPAKA